MAEKLKSNLYVELNAIHRDHLGMRPANERRRYSVTTSLIGSAHSQNDPCIQ